MAEAGASDQLLSLYLHIPFCQVRCAYCDFNTYAGLDHLMTSYARALAKEIRLVGKNAEQQESKGAGERGSRGAVHTIFFGGGTPSLLPLEMLAKIFDALRDSFELTPDCEITLEANPGTVSRAYLDGLRELGVNRLSFGVQSSHPHELRLLDRLHLFGDAAQAVTWARAGGVENVNLDLIFGIPHQTLDMWQATLNRTLALGPDHLSCYALSLEHGTPMRAWVYRGLLPMPDPDLAADMYEWASETLEKYGYAQYEISNWARAEASQILADPRSGAKGATAKSQTPNSEQHIRNPQSAIHNPQFACRHNLQYWRNLPYLGFGAGAHGYAESWRYADVLAPSAYIERIEQGGDVEFPFSPAVAQKTPVTPEDAMGETMMLGMRLVREGVSAAEFERRFGVTLEQKYGKELKKVKELGLVEWDGERTRLTKRRRLLGNRVLQIFV